MSAFIFRKSDSDCDVTETFCDSKNHYTRTLANYAGERRSIQWDRECDGSCKPEKRTKNLRKLLVKAQNDSLRMNDDRILPTVVILDATLTALFTKSGPINGVEFASFYAKRNSRSNDYCIGALHVHWHESFDWHRIPNSETCSTYEITSSLCDGSCRKSTKLTRGEERSLRKQKVDRLQWEAEWNAKYAKAT